MQFSPVPYILVMPSLNMLVAHPSILLCTHFWFETASAQHFVKTFSLGPTQFKACSCQGDHSDAPRTFQYHLYIYIAHGPLHL